MSAASGLVLDCSKPFDPASFIGRGWKELERDERAYAMTKVDFSKCQFLTCLKEGDGCIKGEERLCRLKEEHPHLIRHGGNQFLALWEDYLKNGDNSVLEHLRLTQGITLLDVPGLILKRPYGPRNVLFFFWDGDWDWHFYSFCDDGPGLFRSAVSPAS